MYVTIEENYHEEIDRANLRHALDNKMGLEDDEVEYVVSELDQWHEKTGRDIAPSNKVNELISDTVDQYRI